MVDVLPARRDRDAIYVSKSLRHFLQPASFIRPCEYAARSEHRMT
jgi:hypothetical protein